MNITESDELIPAGMLSLEFMHSDWGDFRGRWRVDYLLKPDWLQEFMAKWHLETGNAPAESEIQALITLRTLMMHIVASLPSGGPAEEDLASLNSILQDAPSTRRLLWGNEKFDLEIEPLVKNWNWVMAEIAGSFAELLVYSDLRRLKVCENPYCGWIFYDETRSRTKRWCTNEKCGNLWKMRRFRARKKTAISD